VVGVGDSVSSSGTSSLEVEVSEMRARRLPGLLGPGSGSERGVHAASAELIVDDSGSGDGGFEEGEGD